MEAPTVDQLITVAGASGITWLVTQIALRALAPAPATIDRWGPLLSVAVAMAVVFIGTFALGLTGSRDLVQAAITGLVAGTGAAGIHDLAKSAGVPT